MAIEREEGISTARLHALRTQYVTVEGPANEQYGNATGAFSFQTYGGSLVPGGLNPEHPDYAVLKLMTQSDYELSDQGTHEADVRQRDGWLNGAIVGGVLGFGSLVLVPGIGWVAAGIGLTGLVVTKVGSEIYYHHQDKAYQKALTLEAGAPVEI